MTQLDPHATVYIWYHHEPIKSKVSEFFGNGHAGLDVFGNCNELYVTWQPGVSQRSDRIKSALSCKRPAGARLGFRDIIHKDNGRTVPNDRFINDIILKEDLTQPDGTLLSPPPRHVGAMTRDYEMEHIYAYEPQPGFGLVPGTPQKLIEVQGQDILAFKPWGLQCDVICRWWLNILKLPPQDPRRQFRHASTMSDLHSNCCSTVAKALYVGGLTNYASPPSNLIYQGARSLVRWITAANRRIDALNQAHAALTQTPEWRGMQPWVSGNQPFDFMGACELPTLAEWKNMSHVRASFRSGFARRHEQVAEIDRLLPLYHEARRVELQGIDPQQPDDFVEDIELLFSHPRSWLNYMAAIQEQCFFHLIQKPRSDRRNAVIRLAKTIDHALRGNIRFHHDAMTRESATVQNPLELSLGFLQAELAEFDRIAAEYEWDLDMQRVEGRLPPPQATDAQQAHTSQAGPQRRFSNSLQHRPPAPFLHREAFPRSL